MKCADCVKVVNEILQPYRNLYRDIEIDVSPCPADFIRLRVIDWRQARKANDSSKIIVASRAIAPPHSSMSRAEIEQWVLGVEKSMHDCLIDLPTPPQWAVLPDPELA